VKLLKISLQHFRQFYGKHEFEFATSPERNVTLLHAENGVGKTTLLNAVLWAFYGETTKKFEQRQKIVNFEALQEGKNLATVEILFEHDGQRYIVQREHFQKNETTGDTRVTSHRIENGNLVNVPALTLTNSVVPPEMAKYFFFDGEHAETFSAETNYKAVGKAIRDMLGCSVAQAAIDDLGYAIKGIEGDISDLPGQNDLQQLQREITDLTAREEDGEKQLAGLREQKGHCNAQIQDIDEKLRGVAAAQQLQKRRDEKTQELKSVEAKQQNANATLARWIGTKGLLVIARRLATESLNFIDEQSLRGRIPSPYNEDFVKELLHAETCICKRALPPGSEEWRHVAELLKNASKAETLGRVVRARSRINTLRDGCKEAIRSLQSTQELIAELNNHHRRLDQEILEIGKELEGAPIKEVSNWERQRQELVRKLSEADNRHGAIQLALRSYQAKIDRLQAEFDRTAVKTTKTAALITKRDLARHAMNTLKHLLGQHEEEARKAIAHEVNKILAVTARREYYFRLDEGFEMNLYYQTGKPVPKGSGENQLMSLAFISSLVDFSRKRALNPDGVLIPGTIAPLVLDSPFGQLDARYRVDTAKFLPTLADQVILLVSSSQGDNEVLAALDQYIGAEYVLISENRGPQAQKSSDPIIVRGQQFDTSLFNCPRNKTRAERVF
jgi:DNA sulfur modification protein DndD